MKKNNLKLLFASLFLSSLTFTSCTDQDDIIDAPVVISPTSQGVYVTNEGQFGSSNGSVSYIDFNANPLNNDLFQKANSRPLGDVVQSMGIVGDKAYLVVNNSKKIEITDASTFKSLGVINGLEMPRYFVAANNKGYVTEWVSFSGNGRVAVIDLTTNTITKTIPVGINPDRMLVINNKLYVTNRNDNKLSVINTQTDAVENTITVGDGPNSLVLDANNKLWVLCGGKKVYNSQTWAYDEAASTAGRLARVNLSTNAVEATMPFGSKKEGDLPSNLNITTTKNSFIYNYQGKVFKIENAASTLPTTALINRDFYGLSIDPKDNSIFGGDAGDFSSNGKVIRYSITGQQLDSFTVGIAPNNFLFK